MWPISLSARLPIRALVGHYPTNKLIGHKLILKREVPKDPPLWSLYLNRRTLCGISPPFGELSPTRGQITYALLTRLLLY